MPTTSSDTRPGLAIISNSITPYRVNLHRLIVARIPELNLYSLITHGIGDFDWQVNPPPEINTVNLSELTEHPLDNPLRRPWIEIRKAAHMIRCLNECRARAVIFNGYRYLSYLRLMQHCRHARIPFFIRNDSNIRNEPRLSPLGRFAKRRTYSWWMKRAAGIFSMGELGDQFFLKYGAEPRQIYRVPYWPDYDSFANVDRGEIERFQRKFGLDERRRYLLFSGRLVRNKRVDLLIDAFSAIAAERPDWGLLIVGDGVLGDELRRRVPELLRPRVVWAGFLDSHEIAPAYHAADVLVLPSDREPWALVVQEAMAAGLTVVASDVVGAAYELITDGTSGRIFPAGDCQALRRALTDVMQTDHIEAYKDRSKIALRQYREQIDPVQEIRRALYDAGVLQAAPSRTEIKQSIGSCPNA